MAKEYPKLGVWSIAILVSHAACMAQTRTGFWFVGGFYESVEFEFEDEHVGFV